MDNEKLSPQMDNTQDQSDYFQNVDTLGNAVSLSDIPSTQPDILNNVETPQKFNILTGGPERSLSDTFPIPKEGESILNTTEKTMPSVLDTSAEDNIDNKKPITNVNTPDTSVNNKKEPEEIKNPYDASDQLGWDPGSGVPVMSSSGLSKEPSRPLFYGAVSKAIIQGTPIGDIKPEDESVFERNMAAIAGSVLKQTPQVITTAGRIWDWLHTNDIPVEETGVYKLNKLMENSEWFQKYIVNASKVATHLGEDSIAEEFVAPFMGWMVAAGIITPIVAAAAPEEILVGLGALGLSLYRAARAGRMVSLAETTAKASEIANNLNKLTGVGKFLSVTAPTFLTRLAVGAPAAGVILMGSDEVESYTDPIFGESIIDKQQRKLGSDDLQRQWVNAMKYYATTSLYAVGIEAATKPLIKFYGKAIGAVGQEAKEFISGGFKRTAETGEKNFPKLITNEDLKTKQPVVEVVKQGQDLVKNDALFENWIDNQRPLRGETNFESQPNNWKELYYDQGVSFWVDKEGNVRTFVDENGKNLPSHGDITINKTTGQMEVPQELLPQYEQQASQTTYSFPGQLGEIIPIAEKSYEFAKNKMIKPSVLYSKKALIRLVDANGNEIDPKQGIKYLFTSEGKISKPIYSSLELNAGEKNVVTGKIITLKNNLDSLIKEVFKGKNSLIQKTPEEFSQDLNKILWSGKDVIDKKTGNIVFNSFDKKLLNKTKQDLQNLNIKDDIINNLFSNLEQIRKVKNDIKNELIPKDKSLKEKIISANKLNDILKERTGRYFESDWNISKDEKLIPVAHNEAVDDLYNTIKNILKRNAKSSGVDLTEQDLTTMMNDLTKATLNRSTNSPEFKLTSIQEALKKNKAGAYQTINLSKMYKNGEFVPNTFIKTEKDLKIFEQFYGIKRATAQKALTTILSDLGNFVYNNKMYSDLYKMHLDSLATTGEGFFYDTALEARRAMGESIEPVKEINLKSPLNDEIYQTPLNGKFTSKSNADALEFIQKFRFDEMLSNMYYKNFYAPLLAASSVLKVVYNPIRWLVDAQQYTSMLVLKSVRSPRSFLYGMKFALKALRGKYSGDLSSDSRLLWDDMVKNKIVSSNVSYNIFNDMTVVDKDGLTFFDKIAEGNIEAKYITNPFTKILRWAFQAPRKGYILMDDALKIVSVFQEHHQLVQDYIKGIKNKTFDPDYGKVHTELTPELMYDLLNRAYENTKATMPNSSRLSMIAKYIGRNPLVSPFAFFDMEIIRNYFGIQAVADKEIANPITRTSGKIRKLGSYAIYAGLGGGAMYVWDWITGISDEQRLAGMRTVPERLQNNEIKIGYDKDKEKKGEEPWYWQNTSHINATNIITSTPYALYLSAKKQANYYFERSLPSQFIHAVGDAINAIYETTPFFEKKLIGAAISDLIEAQKTDGRTAKGKTVFYSSDSVPTKLLKSIDYAIETVLQPGGVGQETKIYNAILNKPGEHGEKYDLYNELGRGALGVPRQPIDRYEFIDRSIGRLQAENLKLSKDATAFFGIPDKPKIRNTDEEIIEFIYNLNKAKYKAFQEACNDYKAMKILKIDDDKLLDRDLPKNILDQVMFGEFTPMSYQTKIDNYENWTEAAKEKFGESGYFITSRNLSALDRMEDDMYGAKPNIKFEEKFPLEKYLPKPVKTPTSTTPGIVNTLPTHVQEQANLQNSPMPNQTALSNPVNQQVATGSPLHNGLTISENALLTPSEQQIRLRERGLA
jgi:hypothetical protein